MQLDEWERYCALVTSDMAEYVKQYVTPLSMSREPGSGVAWGTGSYVQGVDGTWMLTAAHVFGDVPAGARLAHLPAADGDYVAVQGTPQLKGRPVDVAAIPVRLPIEALTQTVVPPSCIAPHFRAEAQEVLFWLGFPGYSLERNDPVMEKSQRRTMYDHLYIPMKPLLSQAAPVDLVNYSGFDPTIHVAVHYPATGKSAVDNSSVAFPNAKGMSGSLLWDTKFVACWLADKQWSPELAEVCGVIWYMLDQPEVLLATKIEEVRRALPGVFLPNA